MLFLKKRSKVVDGVVIAIWVLMITAIVTGNPHVQFHL